MYSEDLRRSALRLVWTCEKDFGPMGPVPSHLDRLPRYLSVKNGSAHESSQLQLRELLCQPRLVQRPCNAIHHQSQARVSYWSSSCSSENSFANRAWHRDRAGLYKFSNRS